MEPDGVSHQKDWPAFRAFLGLICVFGSLLGFGGLYFVPIPASNRDALMLALGIVFGWGSAVVQSEFGSTTTGRRMANAAITKTEKGRSDA